MSLESCACCNIQIDDVFLLTDNVSGDKYRFCSWGCLVAWINFMDIIRKKEESSD